MSPARASLPAAAVAAAAAAAVLLQLLHLPGRPLWLDESWSRWMAEQDWAALRESAARYDTHPPVYYSLLKLWLGLAPATPLAMRLPSIVAALAVLPFAWLCARRLPPLRRDRWGPALALAMTALSPALIVAARQARPYALFALAFAVALWAALSLIEDGREGRRRAWLWLAYLFALELVLWLHGLGALFGAAVGGGLFLALAAGGRLRAELVPWLAVHALAGLAWLPCLLMILEQRRGWTGTWLRFSWGDVPAGLTEGLAAPGAAGWLVLGLALLGAAALLRERDGRPSGLLLLAAALLPAVLAIALSALLTPVFLPRTLVPSVLPLLLLAAAGVVSLTSMSVRATAAGAALLLLAASAFVQVTRRPEEQWTRLAGWLDERVGRQEEVWLLPNELILPLRYARGEEPAYPIRGMPADFPAPDHPSPRRSGTPAVPAMGAEDAARLVRDARRRGVAGIWVVSRLPWLFDPDSTLRRAFATAPAPPPGEFAPLRIEHYRLRPAPIPPPG